MAPNQEPIPKIHFYDLSGPEPWSPCCWNTRYILNYKNLPFSTTQVSFAAIDSTSKKLLGDTPREDDTVPILSITTPSSHTILNESTAIAHLLETTFPASAGYKPLRDLDKVKQYEKGRERLRRRILGWIVFDVYENCLDRTDGSRELFKESREGYLGKMEDVTESQGGEEVVMGEIRKRWEGLRERMEGDDATGEPSYLDFWDAGNVMWIKRAPPEKFEKLKGLWGDDTFVKLMKKVEKYEYH